MRHIERTYKQLVKKLAANLKKTRQRKKIRQAEMIRFGFSERYVQKIESGKHSPNLYTVHRFAEAYGVSVQDLFD